MTKLYSSDYGRAMVVHYKKEEIVNQIGINRLIYDLICKGNLNNEIQLINRVVLKNNHRLDEFIGKYILDHNVLYSNEMKENLPPVIMCIPGALTNDVQLNGSQKTNNITEEKILRDAGFVKLEGISPNISGFVNTPMVYFDDVSMEMIDVLIKKGIIKDAK